MKAIRCINNNVALCLDSQNREVVVFGKGIGFQKPPFDIPLSKIERSYSNINPIYISMINEISDDVLECSMKIYDLIITSLDCAVNTNTLITLADHIQFAVKRYQGNMKLDMPFFMEVQAFYKKEFKIAEKAVQIVKKTLGVELPGEEVSAIALHIVNAEAAQKDDDLSEDQILKEITDIIEDDLKIKIDKQGFNYSRFATHIIYLIKRIRQSDQQEAESINVGIYQDLIQKSPDTYRCSKKITDYLMNKLNKEISDDEAMYILIHINRLYNREGCYQ